MSFCFRQAAAARGIFTYSCTATTIKSQQHGGAALLAYANNYVYYVRVALMILYQIDGVLLLLLLLLAYAIKCAGASPAVVAET